MQTLNGERYTFTLSADLGGQNQGLARGEGATMFMTLLAAFQVLLMRYTGQEDIAVGTPIAGRNRPEIENLIGFFVNTLVIRGDLAPAPGERSAHVPPVAQAGAGDGDQGVREPGRAL